MNSRFVASSLLALLLALLTGTGCRGGPDHRDVVVFGASSLSGLFRDIELAFEARHPEFEVLFEPSGSQIAVRKLSEFGRRADLVALADWRLLKGLVPEKAGWIVEFASSEIVLAFSEHSPFAEQITAANWSKVLLEPAVRLGRVSERTAPLGYQTLLSWRLAGLHLRLGDTNEIARQLEARCTPERVTVDAEELVALLATRTIDYAFIYRSLAESHRLRMLRLAPEVNLGSPALEQWYEKAQLEVADSRSGGAQSIRGASIRFGFAVPRDAPNRKGAESLAAFIVGPEGQSLVQRAGFTPLRSARAHGEDRLPAALTALVAEGAKP